MMKSPANPRNYGVDLLRLVSMYLVTILHVLLLSGSLNAGGTRFWLAWGMEIPAYCAVDCYGLISGYVGYREEKKNLSYQRFGGLWAQIFFYSFGITLLAVLMGRAEGSSLLRAALPVSSGQYWFVSAYIGVFFLAPWLDLLQRKASRAQSMGMAGSVFAVFVVYSTLAGMLGDPFKLQGGYSFAWLLILYLLGGTMRKCGGKSAGQSMVPGGEREGKSKEKARKQTGLVAGMAAAMIFTWLVKIFRPDGRLAGCLVSYTSVTVVFFAFGLLHLFSQLNVGQTAEKLIGAFAPAAFGVYLIHVHPVVWNLLFEHLVWVGQVPDGALIPAVLGGAAAIFLSCLMVEKLRLILFRVCGIDKVVKKFTAFAETKLKNVFSRVEW